jgi:hypothetical protein
MCWYEYDDTCLHYFPRAGPSTVIRALIGIPIPRFTGARVIFIYRNSPPLG